MSISAASIRDEFAAVKLEIMQQRVLTKSQYEAIAHVRQTKENTDAFRLRFPFTVARILPKIQRQMVREARSMVSKDPSVLFEEPYKRDTVAIHTALFGEVAFSETRSETGRFEKPRFGRLHPDVGYDLFYITRVGALAFEYVQETRRAIATPEEKQMLNIAGLRDIPRRKEALQKLRRLNILKPSRLGNVMILVGEEEGTLHCSVPVPVDEVVHSGFFRTEVHNVFAHKSPLPIPLP